MVIKNKKLGKDAKCFIIAEMSANHNGKISKAKEIISLAKKAGADAIKIQTYKAETMTLNSNKKDFLISKDSPWSSHVSMYQLYEKAYTPWEWHSELFEFAEQNDIILFSSPFDTSAVKFLEDLNTPAYKIASPEINDIPLLKEIAKTSKPVILSTGLASFDDLTFAVETLEDNGCNDIAILKCTSSYPAPYEEINLKTLTDYTKKFKCIPGLSDHTLGDAVPIAAIALGAKVIEKHFMIDEEDETPDSFFSMNYIEFSSMVEKIRNIENALGSIKYDLTKSMLKNMKHRRSLYVSKSIKKGELISDDNIKSVRPAYSLHPKYYDQILGKKVKIDLKKGDRLTLDIIEF